MTFNSLNFFLFLPLVYLAFHFSPERLRWQVLLLASYSFYASFAAPQLLIALGLVTAISYACGLRLGRPGAAARGAVFWAGTAGCLAVLVAMRLLPSWPGLVKQHPNWLMSIGVSYFTFQAISYLADVYLEVLDPAVHLGRFALSLAFFPKLLQGPIERTGDLLPQLEKGYRFDYDALRSGTLLFAWGLFRKVVLADRFALYANTVYGDVHAYTGLPLLIATYAYAFQVYFDFAGYTDMARGTARIFGIELSENFKHPYLSTSIADFWRRWHISFSRWILDYIFKPLQMAWRGRGQAGTALALIATFLVSGIWHGASWGFVVWGLLHGSYLAASTWYRPYQKRLRRRLGREKKEPFRAWQILVTFNLVCFAWIFFRAGSLTDAWYVVSHCLDFPGNYHSLQAGWHDFVKLNVLMNVDRYQLFILVAAFAGTVAVYRFREISICRQPAWCRWPIYFGLTMTLILLRVGGTTEFIYRQF